MEEVCLRIIDTKEYQRLDKLKQLGTTNFVFRGASHTRFGHSLGVAHLAEKVVTTLRKNQPSLQITDADVLCVKIAGLCHDLGHGPFSHVFDGVFIKRMYPKGVNKFDISTWRHEDGSVRMFNHILTKNSIDLSDYGLSKVDKLFIEEIIGGVEEDGRKGRRFEKFYLYDIVNNIRSGLDVDKLDYFQRDIRYTNISKNNCTYDRVIEFGRVLPAEPLDVDKKRNKDNELAANSRQTDISTYPRMICYPQKQVREVFEIFQHRFMLHQSVYTHKSVKKIEFMVSRTYVNLEVACIGTLISTFICSWWIFWN